MPLRDHFRPPIKDHHSWEGFHGGWPMVIVQHLVPLLPDEYTAEPRVRLGTFYEIDIGTLTNEESEDASYELTEGNGGVATATIAPPQPTLTVETDLDDQYEFEVRVYDHTYGRQLVAAIELVSPANKDRPENRRAFVRKCATLLQQGVCVSIVDLVTIRQFNLYQQMLAEFDRSDPQFEPEASPIYAVTCRRRMVESRMVIDAWTCPLKIEQPLPTLPLWLSEDLFVNLDLEASYEETCRTLRIVERTAPQTV